MIIRLYQKHNIDGCNGLVKKRSLNTTYYRQCNRLPVSGHLLCTHHMNKAPFYVYSKLQPGTRFEDGIPPDITLIVSTI